MIKISESLKDIINGNSMLQFGLSHNLLNLSKLAEFIKPLVEVRTKKDIKTTALLMNLSRYSRTQNKIIPKIEEFKADNITIISNLCSMTFYKNIGTHKQVNNLFYKVSEENGYITITEGTNEITIIIDQKHLDLVSKHIKEKPKASQENIVGIGIKFDEEYSDTPGFLYLVLQQLMMQGINVIEISSTFTELIIYINKSYTKLAFETMFSRFSK